MTELDRLETKILSLHGNLCFRPTLERAAEVGSLLTQVKDSLRHGEFKEWCRRLPFSYRTAAVYMRVEKVQLTASLPETLTIDRFLRMMADRRSVEVKDVEDVPAVDGCRIVTTDCRKFDWPEVDAVFTDPVWTDPASYQWLGEFCKEKLKLGGLLLCQVGTATMPDRIQRLASAGLTYRWCLSVVYGGNKTSKPFSIFTPTSALVVVMSKGKIGKHEPSPDSMIVPGHKKIHHPFQQPVRPWCVWANAWVRPGGVIADPFAGSGSIGVAVRAVGGRGYIGTEMDDKTARVARKRVAAVVAGAGWSKELDD